VGFSTLRLSPSDCIHTYIQRDGGSLRTVRTVRCDGVGTCWRREYPLYAQQPVAARTGRSVIQTQRRGRGPHPVRFAPPRHRAPQSLAENVVRCTTKITRSGRSTCWLLAAPLILGASIRTARKRIPFKPSKLAVNNIYLPASARQSRAEQLLRSRGRRHPLLGRVLSPPTAQKVTGADLAREWKEVGGLAPLPRAPIDRLISRDLMSRDLRPATRHLETTIRFSSSRLGKGRRRHCAIQRLGSRGRMGDQNQCK
jgi:hypothetical protein